MRISALTNGCVPSVKLLWFIVLSWPTEVWPSWNCTWNNKGFYKAEVTDSVWFKKKKAMLCTGFIPVRWLGVKDFTFREDSSFRAGGLPESSPLVQLVLRDTNHTLLHQEMPMDIEILEEERERITHMLRQNGYYNFSKNFIHYYADTSRSGNPEQAHLLLSIVNSVSDSMAYRKYKIKHIQVNLVMIPCWWPMDSIRFTAYPLRWIWDCLSWPYED